LRRRGFGKPFSAQEEALDFHREEEEEEEICSALLCPRSVGYIFFD
jgi:hypothetical protein